MNQIFMDVKRAAFKCPTCGYHSQQHSYTCSVSKLGTASETNILLKNPLTNKKNSATVTGLMGYINCTECDVCGFIALWINDYRIFPHFPKEIPEPNQDMPEEIKTIYTEAANVTNWSPRSAAALLRLCLEKLLEHLKISGKSLNEKISNSNFPEKLLNACDAVRIYGNNAVHPSEIQFDDKADTALTLFELINIIVDRLITDPKKIERAYNSLSPEHKNKIEDKNNKKGKG